MGEVGDWATRERCPAWDLQPVGRSGRQRHCTRFPSVHRLGALAYDPTEHTAAHNTEGDTSYYYGD